MAAANLPDVPNSKPLPPQPPPEEFWKKYSPHYEFQISTVATGVLHVLAVTAIIIIATRLMKPDEKTPVPIRSMTVVADARIGADGGEAGSGGGEAKTDVADEKPVDPIRPIPEAELNREVVAASAWLPDLKDNPEALKIVVQMPNYSKLAGLDDDMKKRIAEGNSGKRGSGDNGGMGTDGNPGKGNGGAGGPGDPSSSYRRSGRWRIDFKISDSREYVKQLAAFRAKIVVPMPPDFEAKKMYFEDVSELPPKGRLLTPADVLPKMAWVDDSSNSARRMARVLGLNFDPPKFLVFFPKEIEDELAEKERAYRNRKEEDIFQTTFNVLEVNRRYEIRVTDQIPMRK